MSCCKNPHFLGCFNSCADVITDIPAPITGTYQLVYKYLGATYSSNFDAVATEMIVLPNIFNEYGEATISIIDPNGDEIEHNGTTCFTLLLSVEFS